VGGWVDEWIVVVVVERIDSGARVVVVVVAVVVNSPSSSSAAINTGRDSLLHVVVASYNWLHTDFAGVGFGPVNHTPCVCARRYGRTHTYESEWTSLMSLMSPPKHGKYQNIYARPYTAAQVCTLWARK
jgi:hypothetical protein